MKIFRIISLSIAILFGVTSLSFAQSLNPTELDSALESAKKNDKKVLIDVYAEWCPYCEKMHTEVYTQSDIIEAVNDHFYLVKINIESQNEVNYLGNRMAESEFAKMLNSSSLPTTFFMNGDGDLLGMQPGLLPADVFEDLLNFVGSDAFESLSFEEYRNRD
ncbi:thioredoxin family protein [Rhodohalobacter sp. 8-1]|uniref:thioredoxin family protein n=1 Tax=Rhodohalobacter sp. 8-1 TaxID=3131972 RepID=UPI0030EDDD37